MHPRVGPQDVWCLTAQRNQEKHPPEMLTLPLCFVTLPHLFRAAGRYRAWWGRILGGEQPMPWAKLIVLSCKFCVFHYGFQAVFTGAPDGTPRGPFNYTPVGINSISFGSPHVRPTGCTCGEPNEIKKNAHPKYVTALFVSRPSISA